MLFRDIALAEGPGWQAGVWGLEGDQSMFSPDHSLLTS